MARCRSVVSSATEQMTQLYDVLELSVVLMTGRLPMSGRFIFGIRS